jgi:hypothetical protein
MGGVTPFLSLIVEVMRAHRPGHIVTRTYEKR